ncbi:MAG TPA: hypothetical protein VFL30_07390 [Rhodanobacteraceae bacterium]|nr:hypothetical protein [Rhodanobacteraceae bacterium]
MTPRSPADASDSTRASRTLPWWIGIALAIALAAIVYAPGLKGVYVFDDFPNIVDNVHLHVTTTDWRDWAEAIWSSPSTDLHRPLASLSFAVNHFFTGIDPMPMKVVNLAIHLVNGALLFVLLRRLFRVRAVVASDSREPRRDLILATLVAAAWLVHPINLTAVLYIVQRMESLAQVFVLAGLVFYCSARERQLRGLAAGWRLWIGVPACTLLGIAAKESAALLPLYALLAEWLLIRDADARTESRRERRVFFAIFLALPAIAGLAWLLPHMLASPAWSTRPFTLGERLLSEPRALLDYVRWTLLPLPGTFSLYRDDFAVSRTLVDPWTTLPSIAGLVAMPALAWLVRRRRPLVALGIAWFFAAHLLTATIVPLELVFEHRNYFASIGLLVAAGDLLLPRAAAPLPIVRRAVAAIFVIVCAATTLMRSIEWGSPVRLAFAEAAAHPNSPRATYEIGRVLVIMTGYDPASPALPRAIEALDHAASVPDARTQPDAALIVLAARTGRPIEDAWWRRMTAKLASEPPTHADSSALMFLTDCMRSGACKLDRDAMRRAFDAAIAHEPKDPATLYAYATFAYSGLGDPALALKLARDAVAYGKGIPQYRVNLASFLIDLGKLDDAASEIATLRAGNRLGAQEADIDRLEARLSSAKQRPADASADASPGAGG